MPQSLHIEVNGEQFEVHIAYPENGVAPAPATKAREASAMSNATAGSSAGLKTIIAPLEGKFFLTRDASDKAKRVGDTVKKGETVGYIEAMKVYNAIAAEHSGKIVEVSAGNGDEVYEDDVLFKIE